jgi:molybdopterin-guanine dinucleotide biosynthesis protein A
MGGEKAVVTLAGRPLIAYPLAAMSAVVRDLTIVAKVDTVLPAAGELGAVRVVREPSEPRHPLVGIVHALRAAAGRPVLVCAADLPFLTADVLRELAQADPCGAPAVIAAGAGGALQPLLGCYRPEAAPLLEPAAREAVAPVRAAVAAIAPRRLEVPADVLFNVNSPEDLARAEELVAAAATGSTRR